MHVFTIPPSVPFLRTLVEALVDGRLVDGFIARENPERIRVRDKMVDILNRRNYIRNLVRDVNAALES